MVNQANTSPSTNPSQVIWNSWKSLLSIWLCTALRRLGVERDLTTQELLVKAGHGIPERFPESVLREADGLPGRWRG